MPTRHRSATLLALVAAVAGAAAAAAPTPAYAQGDDWEVKRDPFDKAVIARWKGILARSPNDAGALAKLLELYRRYRTVDLLVSEYDKVLASKPGDYATLVVLARLARARGDDATALTRFEEAARARPSDAAVWLEVGQLYRGAGKQAEAKRALEAARAGAGGQRALKMKALRGLADLALAAGDVAATKTYFEEYLALDPKNVQLRLELGDALAGAGRHADAIATFQQAEKLLAGDPPRRVEAVARIGAALEQQGQDDAAVTEYRRAIKLVPRGYYLEVELTARIVDIFRRKQDLAGLLRTYERDWAEARRGHFEWDTLARLYEETGDQDKAVAAYRKAVAKAPWELDTQRRLIALLENVGKDVEALRQLETVVKVAPGEARFQLELAERYWRRADGKKALETLRRLEQRFPGDAGILTAAADLYTRWGKEDLAVAAFERLARLEPDEPSHLVTLGAQYFQRGEKDKALATWRRLANGKSAAGYARLGEVLAEHGMPADARTNYDKAIKLEPKNADLYRGRAQVFESTKAFADAVGDWEKVLALTPATDRAKRKEAQRRLVQLITRWGARVSEYHNRWTAAFKKSPPDVEAGYFLVEYYGRRPQKGEPLATLEALRRLVPADQETLLDLVKAYRHVHRYDDAVALLLELAKLAPAREREVYSQIAEIKTEARSDQEAIEWAQKALAKAPKDPVAYERLAERYVEMQRFTDAIAAYQKTLELDPRNYKAHFALARLHVQESKPAAAADLYRKILRNATDEEIVGRAGREAIDLEELTDTLGELEKIVAPLSFMMSHRPVYRRLLVDLYLRYVPHLVERTRYGSAEVKAAARTELSRLGAHGMKPLLEALHDDKDPHQQRTAVAVLGHLGNRGAAAPLVQLAVQPGKGEGATPRPIGTLRPTLDWEVRIDALVAAGRLGDPGIIDRVAPLARHDEVAMREAAVFTLGRTGDARAVPGLLAALDDSRDSVQVLACLGLAQVAEARAVTAMAEVVAQPRRHDQVRAACAFGLGHRRASGRGKDLLAALVDNQGETQRLAGWALGQLADPGATGPLLAAYFARTDDRRAELAWAITRAAGAPVAAAPAPDFGDYPLHAGKFDARTRLDRLVGDTPPASLPTKVLDDHGARIAAGLEQALGQHRDVVLRVLTDLDGRPTGIGLVGLVDGGADARTEAALAAIASKIAPAVAAHAASTDAKVRAVTVSVLAKIGGAASEAAIAAGLTDKVGLVRQAAMTAVVTVRRRAGRTPPALRAGLAQAIAAGSWQDRRAAAVAMGALATEADLAALGRAATDASSYVREAVASALGEAGQAGGAALVLSLSRDDVAPVRAAAARALRRLGGTAAQERLRELARDPDPAVARAATTP
ncbi:MAG: HEAT repeat domain-containing protein [Kofleriaceae bacterium]|nr:HEAT repeat domain-containing protein [Kofleriaceae bacterium]MBP6835867.1 HEAT repeat domain-containing protein [Kofleriaceae bacterium]